MVWNRHIGLLWMKIKLKKSEKQFIYRGNIVNFIFCLSGSNILIIINYQLIR